MAKTNDEQLFIKVVSKPDFRNTFSNIEKKEILDNRSAPEAWHIKELMLQIAREARLAERAKCIAQLKDHQAHCDNCANDRIEMAIIILETNEAIE